MARREDQSLHGMSNTKSCVIANLHRSGTNRSLPASRRSHLELCGADVVRYGQGGTEPTLDEVLPDPIIRLMMKRDNVTEDQLHFLRIATRHINR
jgi:hypothetical protein